MNRQLCLHRKITPITPCISATWETHFIRFERVGSMNDLNRAIITKEQAVALTPKDHPNHAIHLNSLASTLRRRFERTGSLVDIDLAITMNELAIASTPEDNPSHAMNLN